LTFLSDDADTPDAIFALILIFHFHRTQKRYFCATLPTCAFVRQKGTPSSRFPPPHSATVIRLLNRPPLAMPDERKCRDIAGTAKIDMKRRRRH
jgi:hypothetical protein